MPKKEKHIARKIRHKMPPPSKVIPDKKHEEEKKKCREKVRPEDED